MLKWIAVIVLILVAIPILVVALVVFAANIDPGRRFIERQAASLTGGTVRIQGLSGHFPDALRADQIQVWDAKGPYITIDDLVLDWSPLKLVHHIAQIDQLHADRLLVDRLPGSSATTQPGNSPFTLPIQVDLRHLSIAQAVIAAPVAGVAATLTLDGSASLQSLTEGSVQLDVDRLDSPGRYTATGRITPGDIQATLKANEPAKGLISSLAHLPDLGAIGIQASVSGPRDSLSTQVGITAGQSTASASGTVDLQHEAADLAVSATAPAMTPAPDVSWESVLVDAKVAGPFTRPDANGTIQIRGLNAAGTKIGALDANVSGDQGQVTLHATVRDLHVPGPKPDLMAADPVTLDATARLDAPDRPVTFTLHHKLIAAEGTAQTAGNPHLQAHLTLPDLTPLGAAGGIVINGSTDLNVTAAMQDGTTTATVTGRVGVTGGMEPAPALIGPDAQIDVAASMHGNDVILSHLTVNGKALTLSAQGGLGDQKIDLDWSVGLTDLAAVQASVSGQLNAKGHAAGALNDLAVQADLGADLAAKGFSSGHITAAINATGLPAKPHASINASGTLLGAPLTLALTTDEDKGTIKVDIAQAAWKSLKAGGALSLAPQTVIPAGTVHVDFTRLADLQPLLGRPIAGQATATLDSDDKAVKLNLTLSNAAIPGTATLSKAVLTATVTDPAGHPTIDSAVTIEGVSASSAKAVSGRVTAKGPLDALGLTVTLNAPQIAGSPSKVTAAGTLNATARTLALAQLEASWKQQTLRLLAPARFDFASGVAADRVRLGFRQAELTVSGKAGNTLDLTASLRNLPADIGAIADPAFAANGTIAADVKLTGTTARPEGTIKLTATGIKQRQGPGQALPPANLTANATLAGTTARIDTRLTAGLSHLTATGTVPLTAAGALDLHTNGQIDLAMLDPLLTAAGRRARGAVTLNANVSGTVAAPLVQGTATLSNGDVTDYAQGVHISDLAATIQASGDTIRIASLTGKAGPGTVGGSGTVTLTGAMPIDLHFTASNARPLASDLMTATIDADLTVRGEVTGNLQAGGTIRVRQADIQIPDKLPASIAVLPVRNANAPPPPPTPPAPPSIIALNLTLDAPEQVFIRGRGLVAELGGTIHIHGNATDPVPDGGLQLRQGTFSIVGSTLTFTQGSIDFSGAGITNPSIHFVATSSSASITATLTVSGTPKDPKITLTSVPDMPQDEILAQLLFNTSTSKLSPFQMAEIAAALASFSGATSGFDPLESVRNRLGLDRLSVGSGSTGNPSLEAGRYLARGVYLGAKQGTGGGGPQATIQIDLTKGLKLETTAGSGSTSATGAASSADAASVGLTYQFEY